MMTRYYYDAAGREREIWQEKEGDAGLYKVQTIDYQTAKTE